MHWAQFLSVIFTMFLLVDYPDSTCYKLYDEKFDVLFGGGGQSEELTKMWDYNETYWTTKEPGPRFVTIYSVAVWN